MAVLNSILRGQLKGRMGNQYFSHTVTAKGRPATIVGTINDSPANPRTNSQMAQRARFANAVKFYKHATSNFFKFAFEDKKKNESDYNAFMRHNIERSLILDKSLVDSPLFPAIGNKWMISRGSLGFGSIANYSISNNGGFYSLSFPENPKVSSVKDADNTVQTLSLFLTQNYSIKVGDIITLVFVQSEYKALSAGESDSIPSPLWQIIQFKVSLSNTLQLSNLQSIGADLVRLSIDEGTSGTYPVWIFKTYSAAQWASLVITRKKSSGLYATTSFLEPNKTAASMVDSANVSSAIEAALTSWQAETAAILQGGVADSAGGVADNTDYSDVTITSIKQSVNSGSTAGSILNIGSMTYALNTITIEGTNLPDVSPTSSNVAICSVSNFTHTSDTSVSFIVNRGSSSGSFTIYYAGKAVVSGTVPQQITGDQGVQQGSDGTGING